MRTAKTSRLQATVAALAVIGLSAAVAWLAWILIAGLLSLFPRSYQLL